MTPDVAVEVEQEAEEMLTQTARFMIHLRTHGWAYAIAMLIASEAGVLDTVLATASQCV